LDSGHSLRKSIPSISKNDSLIPTHIATTTNENEEFVCYILAIPKDFT
jgi:hypothetical protein